MLCRHLHAGSITAGRLVARSAHDSTDTTDEKRKQHSLTASRDAHDLAADVGLRSLLSLSMKAVAHQ